MEQMKPVSSQAPEMQQMLPSPQEAEVKPVPAKASSASKANMANKDKNEDCEKSAARHVKDVSLSCTTMEFAPASPTISSPSDRRLQHSKSRRRIIGGTVWQGKSLEIEEVLPQTTPTSSKSQKVRSSKVRNIVCEEVRPQTTPSSPTFEKRSPTATSKARFTPMYQMDAGENLPRLPPLRDSSIGRSYNALGATFFNIQDTEEPIAPPCPLGALREPTKRVFGKDRAQSLGSLASSRQAGSLRPSTTCHNFGSAMMLDLGGDAPRLSTPASHMTPPTSPGQGRSQSQGSLKATSAQGLLPAIGSKKSRPQQIVLPHMVSGPAGPWSPANRGLKKDLLLAPSF